ncbi:transcription factor IIIB 90 kDa subunit [Cylas formicarius]|uniref:transcription factor IIIB 90 kDa subunit n=1 Tax=Cylas formicarius TaxID=197179 RepID=UPI00295839C1|nr:transcription factor IIIB 90 kDa subunit [Cylas formicarius]XP_060518430.1 transcription factor IIIB 90 kDa subunit [Cylas formicarius]XP_060518438.1 transcription factor IIIB 90 kDa subunit [Cylas formicarius]
MSSGKKCQNCGSSEIEVDPARGDAVCTNCGSVLEDSIIVSEIQFEEGAHGTTSAIGQFVAADSSGGATKFGAAFHVVGLLESRELTLRKARGGITHLGNQLKLNQHCIDTACSFFKMALSKNLTRGRRNTHIHAACVYLTCRTEGTAHLLIDISDVLQICCYELGRTYLKLSQALCINVPSVDPCIYILRFASKLDFGDKTQQVANTALRLVQRMKRDSIHSGRRPSGLCGAALLIAARLHEFSRTLGDVLKVVKVHESTMRRRLIEFGDTPSSTLTLEEFMTVDLEEEQDPPSFKAARKKDKERLQKLMEEEADTLTELQKQIETQLDINRKRRRRNGKLSLKIEDSEAEKFAEESTMHVINKIIEEAVDDPTAADEVKALGPNIAGMGLANSLEDTSNAPQPEKVVFNLDFEDLDDEELDSYIMSEQEYRSKNGLWTKLNADYLEKQKAKAEQAKREAEEGKPEKKRKRPNRKKIGPANSAGEAIEKIIQEKKISSKINYDVLKSLNSVTSGETRQAEDNMEKKFTEPSPKKHRGNKRLDSGLGLPFAERKEDKKEEEKMNVEPEEEEEELDEYYEEEPAQKESTMGVLEMLKQHREDEAGDDDYEYGYYEEDY